jgi:hypothetical protein
MNLPSAETTKRDDVDAAASFEYEENGNIIKQIMTNYTAETVDFFDYIYDSNGKRIRANYTGADGYLLYYTFVYDNEGRLISQKYEEENGYKYDYNLTYDENGNIIREEYVINGESVIYNIDCIIDEKGRLVKEVCTYPDDSQESMEYTYNEKGYLIKEVYKMYDGNQTVYDFTYDEHGNVIKEVFTNVDGTTNYVKTEYKLMYIPTGITEGTYAFFVDFWGDRL